MDDSDRIAYDPKLGYWTDKSGIIEVTTDAWMARVDDAARATYGRDVDHISNAEFEDLAEELTHAELWDK